MSYIILSRNPVSKRVVVIEDDDQNPVIFESRLEAEEAAETTTVCRAWGFQIVELEI